MYDLGTGVVPGKHVLTIRVDNTVKIDLGVFVSALFGGTETDMNGIVGRIELAATDPVAIDNVRVDPDVEKKEVGFFVRTINATGERGQGNMDYE